MGTIHIIEDDPILLEMLTTFISGIAYHVRGFVSAEAYLGYMDDIDYEHPLLILSDINMSGMSGLQLLKIIRDRTPNTRYMLMTGDPGQIKESNLDDLGVEKVWSKPFPLSHLRKDIDNISKGIVV